MKVEEARIDNGQYAPIEITNDTKMSFSAIITLPAEQSTAGSENKYTVHISNHREATILFNRPDYPQGAAKIANKVSLTFQSASSGYTIPQGSSVSAGVVFQSVIKCMHYYIKKYRPSGIGFTAASDELKRSYFLMSSEVERSELFTDPSYMFANKSVAIAQNSFNLVRKSIAEAYKAAMNSQGEN